MGPGFPGGGAKWPIGMGHWQACCPPAPMPIRDQRLLLLLEERRPGQVGEPACPQGSHGEAQVASPGSGHFTPVTAYQQFRQCAPKPAGHRTQYSPLLELSRPPESLLGRGLKLLGPCPTYMAIVCASVSLGTDASLHPQRGGSWKALQEQLTSSQPGLCRGQAPAGRNEKPGQVPPCFPGKPLRSPAPLDIFTRLVLAHGGQGISSS